MDCGRCCQLPMLWKASFSELVDKQLHPLHTDIQLLLLALPIFPGLCRMKHRDHSRGAYQQVFFFWSWRTQTKPGTRKRVFHVHCYVCGCWFLPCSWQSSCTAATGIWRDPISITLAEVVTWCLRRVPSCLQRQQVMEGQNAGDIYRGKRWWTVAYYCSACLDE